MDDIQEILIDESALAGKVIEMAGQISRDYAGKDLILICVLKGAAVFASDLMRHLAIPVQVEFVQAASYGSGTESSRSVRIVKDTDTDVRGRHVLLVDTIADSGRTLDHLLRTFQARAAASVSTAVLLDKRSRRHVDVPLTFRGFEIEDRFVVGYGLDYAERYRNLPYIAAIGITGSEEEGSHK